MEERDPQRSERRPDKSRAKAAFGPRRQSRAGRAFDLVTLSLAIWLGVLVAVEGIQKVDELAPDSGVASNLPALHAAPPAGSGG